MGEFGKIGSMDGVEPTEDELARGEMATDNPLRLNVVAIRNGRIRVLRDEECDEQAGATVCGAEHDLVGVGSEAVVSLVERAGSEPLSLAGDGSEAT